jgi:hypothetical protein
VLTDLLDTAAAMAGAKRTPETLRENRSPNGITWLQYIKGMYLKADPKVRQRQMPHSFCVEMFQCLTA